jgi:hypothetical protein
MLLRIPTAFVALLSLAAVVVATPADIGRLYSRATGRVCGTDISPDDVVTQEKAFASLLAQKSPEDSSDDSPDGWNPPSSTWGGPTPTHTPKPCPCSHCNFTIPVYFHVIYTNKNPDCSGGYIPDSQIYDQINVLNKDYAGSGVSFTLISIDRTESDDWFNNAGPGTPQQTAMKNALRLGGANALNIYTVGFTNVLPSGLLGYATFPWLYPINPKDDGVVLLYSTLPGGNLVPYNEGRTGTHEVGHWVGLYHTFMPLLGSTDGCIGPGDFVADTPAEHGPAYGCPVGLNTCPDVGPDPVHNYMDYTDDSCMNNFTPGQISRICDILKCYRS